MASSDSGGLVDLARRFVELSDELEEVRNEIKRAVLNGTGGDASRPTPAGRPGDQAPKAARTIAAAANEARLVEVIKATPGLSASAIAKATGGRRSTTGERLRRLQAKGAIERADAGGWSVAQP